MSAPENLNRYRTARELEKLADQILDLTHHLMKENLHDKQEFYWDSFCSLQADIRNVSDKKVNSK